MNTNTNTNTKTKTKTTVLRWQRLAGALLLSIGIFTVSGCSDEEPNNGASMSGMNTNSAPNGATATMPGAGANTGMATGMTPGNSAGGEHYAVLSQIFTPDSRKTYLIGFNRLEPGTKVDIAQGIEIPGRAIGISVPRLGAMIVGTSESPILTKYVLDPNGKFQKDKELSFASHGVASVSEYQGQFHVVSPEKAYFFDGSSAQMMVFNPTTMTIIKAQSLSMLARSGQRLTFAPLPLRAQNRLVVAVGWRSADNLKIPSETAVVTVDVTNDSFTVALDTRCGYARDGAVGPDGKMYLVSDAYAAAVHRLAAANAPKPCMLRFDPMTAKFDPNFHVDTTVLGGGAVAGSMVPGPNQSAFIRVLHEQTAAKAITPMTPPRALASAPVWQWRAVTLGDQPTATVVQGALGAGSQIPLQVGKRLMLPELAKDRSKTTMYEVGAQGISTQPTIELPGLVFSLNKVR